MLFGGGVEVNRNSDDFSRAGKDISVWRAIRCGPRLKLGLFWGGSTITNPLKFNNNFAINVTLGNPVFLEHRNTGNVQ